MTHACTPPAACSGARLRSLPRCRRRRAPVVSAAAAPSDSQRAQRTPRFFVNLTNGIEAVPTLHALSLPFSYCRLQSSLCEAQAMEKLCLELDANLLTSLALGHDCFVIDYASRNKKRGVPRALWYGLEFVTFALDTLWLGAPVRPPVLRGVNVTADFQHRLSRFHRTTRQRLRYYARFAPPQDGVRLWGVCGPTQRDADDAFYNDTLRACAAASPVPLSDGGGQHQHGRAAAAALALGDATAGALAAAGLRVFAGGVGHAELRAAAAEAGAAAADATLVGDDSGADELE